MSPRSYTGYVRYDHPKSATHANGIYGGIGTRPAHENWTPGAKDEADAPEAVPKRFRRLRLKRTKSRTMYSDQAYKGPEFFVLMVCAAFALIVVLIGLGVLDLPIK